MSIQLKSTRNRKIKLAASAGAVLVGVTYVILTTFPHLKTSIYNIFTGTESQPSNDNEPIELRDSDESNYEESDYDSESEAEVRPEVEVEASNGSIDVSESLVNVEKWSDDNLKSWLSEKDITPPSNASHNNLVSLVNSIKENST
ncbi:hypothetical protein CAAN1_22S00188 [[Candida] anglica]|uniref:Uncharacterized protein n=1 Tax=[Candida] anglica TaxID=148631 RepID=A0ABP0EKV8_9ASCO